MKQVTSDKWIQSSCSIICNLHSRVSPTKAGNEDQNVISNGNALNLRLNRLLQHK